MADQSSVTLQKKADRRPKELSKSFVPKKKDSTRILGPEMTDVNQDHKRRCLEKLVVRRERMTQQNVEDAKCALEVEVIDDTALIEATAAVARLKNRYRKESRGDAGGLRIPKEENDGKKKRNKGFKKQGQRCSMKCLNEKKSKAQVVEDKSTSEKQIPEGKGHKGYRKMSAKVKYVYQKKDTKNVTEKIVGVAIQEADVNLKVSIGDEKESTINMVETDVNLKVPIGDEKESTIKLAEADVNLKVPIGDEKESTINLVETETVNEKDNGLKLTPHNEAEDENVSATTDVGSKKSAYSREEMEALRFVDEQGQKTKWIEVYSGFASSVATEYTRLVVDANNRPTQRYNRVVNCGSSRHANPILSMPAVLPLCSPSNNRKFEPYDRVWFRVNFN
ncbi:hypothetical protein L1987_59792 [Smallanthus sonchifolius]|uniref:Uncharacterized protein n=1 Tax=Smallanthus sonchifolius TaxID=185202 RepID=A0ACB9D6B3_9ASTR|nr:hypothetical protein L1987_59792 [Smallanthus sonchifolius]